MEQVEKPVESWDKKISIFETALKILSILPVLGVLYQVRVLYTEYKMAGLSFFSWTQVINDTVGILPLILPLIASILLGIIISNKYGALLKESKKHTWKTYFRLIIVWILVWILSTIMLWITFFSIFWDWSVKGFFYLVGSYFLYYTISSLFVLLQKRFVDIKDEMIHSLVPWVIWYLLSIVVIYFTFPVYQQSTANNFCIWRDNDTLIPISYMNDKYAFYSGSVLSDTGSESVWTWMVVYSRKEWDRIFKCTLKGQVIRRN